MAHPAGETESDVFRLDFDRRLMLRFCGSVATSDAGLLAYRELGDALALTAMAVKMLADARTGKNGRYALVDLLRQSVFGRSHHQRRRESFDGHAFKSSRQGGSASQCQGKWPDQPLDYH